MNLSSKGNALSLEINFWWDAEDNAIHIGSNDKDPGSGSFMVAIRADESKPSGHPYLFRELAKCLRSKGAPAPPI
jgi:hypothetical protein